MRKTLFVLLTLAATLHVSAQKYAGAWTITPKAGANLATMNSFTYGSVNYWTIEPKWKVGLVAGVETEWQMTQRSGFSFGVLYAQQGCRWGHVDNERKDMKLTTHCLNFPVLANFYVLPGLAVKAGLQFGYSLSNRVSYNQMATDVMNQNNTEKKLWERESYNDDNVKKFDLSIPVGLSYNFYDVVFDLRYNFGLNSMHESINGVHNHMVMLTIGSCIEL